jgi:putative phosphonate metabolism protein
MRYALYFAEPATDPLMQLGNAWLGRDTFTGKDLAQPEIQDLGAERFRELTADPRRYGFHGTLKAPFSLREEQSEDALLQACAEFASEIAPYEIQRLGVNRLGRFLALTPEVEEPALRAFASLCVRRFEPFRAPLSAADVERRRKANLSPKLDAYMTAWGYPYIFDEFRFHMTLSNKLEDDREAALLRDAAESFFAEVTGKPRLCRHFALYAEPMRGGPFHVHTVFQLTGSIPSEDALAEAGRLSHEEHA